MIKASTYQFLKELSENNNRDWFQLHKTDYDAARENILNITSSIIKRVSEFDNTIPENLVASNCVMRIYRDTRFSKDKTPYKTNFGIAISVNGKNFNGPGYYIHIEPGKSFVAGGSWYPESEQLKAIRQEIDYNASDFLTIIQSKNFKKSFGDLDIEGKLKTAPKGYANNHELIEYLKLKCFVASKSFSNSDFEKQESESKIVETFKSLYPFMVFLRNAIS